MQLKQSKAMPQYIPCKEINTLVSSTTKDAKYSAGEP